MTGDINAIGRTFEPFAVGGLTLLAFFGSALGAFVSTVRREPPSAGLRRAVEGFVLAWAGGALARLFVSFLLAWGHDGPIARLLVGWAFFFWPGAIDSVPTAYGSPLFDANGYLLLATLIGGFAGAMDGAYGVHDWRRAGAFTFVADMTWGLAGTTTACFIHVYNLATRAVHCADERTGTHRYLGGFHAARFTPFVFGSIISQSKVRYQSGARVELHALTPIYPCLKRMIACHRSFGPFFALTYFGWVTGWLPAGLAAGLVSDRFGVYDSLLWTLYLNNPWQALIVPNTWLGQTKSSFLAFSTTGIAGYTTLFAASALISIAAAVRLAWF